jgi:hypothetical protein
MAFTLEVITHALLLQDACSPLCGAAAACGYSAEEKTGEGLWRAVTTALKERKWSAEQMAKTERVWNELLVLWPALNGTVQLLSSPFPSLALSRTRALQVSTSTGSLNTSP